MKEVILVIQVAMLDDKNSDLIYANTQVRYDKLDVVNTHDMFIISKHIGKAFKDIGWTMFDITNIKNAHTGDVLYEEASVDFSVVNELKLPQI